MRDTTGLVDSLVRYIKGSLEENKTEDKVRQAGEMEQNLCCCSGHVSDFYLSACACVSAGGGK